MALAVGLTLAAGCGGDGAADNAVEAREQNVVERNGVRYRVIVFRELNVHQPPDEAVWTGTPPAVGRGLYMAVLRACASGDGKVQTTGRIHLEDAFGQRFAPRSGDTADDYAYRPRELDPGDCQPRPESAADATFGGSVLVFSVPFDSIGERPMVLVIEDARIQLDL
jgi:hypothetical protein